jgi:xanthine dehydrogenase accessory factor
VDGWEILQQAAELSRRGEVFALATVVWRQGPSSSQPGARAIISAEGDLHGWIGGACAEPAVVRAAREVIDTGVARLLLLGSPEQFGYSAQHTHAGASGAGGPGAELPEAGQLPAGMTFVPIACQSEGAIEVYIEPVLPVPHLVVVGTSPMASTLAELARALGWQASLIAGQDFTAADAGERSLVVVATQGHDDEGVLERAVAAKPAYLGLVSSDRRGAAVLGYLADRGIEAGLLGKVRVPAGLDLGRTTHREIAVAILAELVQLRASGGLAGDSSRDSKPASTGRPTRGDQLTHGDRPAPERRATQATDLVCGMPVDVGPASRYSQYQGDTYYFCGAGCQRAFDADPAAYAKKETRC